jgi:hypothetical protein
VDGSDLSQLPPHLGDRQIQLLMSEYEHLTTAFHSNEEMGERRVNVFFGLIGAVYAAIGLAADQFHRDAGRAYAMTVASLALLAFGLVTLRRLMERNMATTSYLNGLRRIRAFFVRQQPELAEVLPFIPARDPLVRARGKGRYEGKREDNRPAMEHARWWGIGKAGYLETAAVANCLLAAVVIGAALSPTIPIGWMLTGALVGAGGTWLAQMTWTRETYAYGDERARRKRNDALEWWARATSE